MSSFNLPETLDSWNANDIDGDKLTYSLLYSRDGGKSWLPLGVDIGERQFPVNLQDLPGSNQALFRVIATDGVLTGMAQSNVTLHVPDKPP